MYYVGDGVLDVPAAEYYVFASGFGEFALPAARGVEDAAPYIYKGSPQKHPPDELRRAGIHYEITICAWAGNSPEPAAGRR